MATPRPKDMQFYAPRPQQNFDISGYDADLGGLRAQGAGDYFAYTDDRMSTNMAPVAALARAAGTSQQPTTFTAGVPRPDIAGAFAPRPSEVAPLSEAQKRFLAGDRQVQASSPMQAQVAQKERERVATSDAKTQENRNFQLKLHTEPERIRAEVRERIVNAQSGSREKIEGLKASAAMDRERLKTASAQEVAGIRKSIAESEMEAEMQQLIAQGKVPGTPEFDSVQNVLISRLQAEGIIESQLQADALKRKGVGDMASSAFKIMSDPFASPTAKERAREIIDAARATFDAPAADVAAHQAQYAQPQVAQKERIEMIDGQPGFSEDERKYDFLVTTLKSTQSPAQRLKIESAMKLLKNRILKSKQR